MPWWATALMAMTFCMTSSPVAALRHFLGQIDNQRTFRDVCTPRGKWFHAGENCFVAASATKQFGSKCE
jgi:hypothetical protein